MKRNLMRWRREIEIESQSESDCESERENVGIGGVRLSETVFYTSLTPLRSMHLCVCVCVRA